ncbi:hypothetical protein [Polynucleobacter sp. UB-Raua-W9]|uniref:hypothetical protein n=1 Tax=Polynucleobacter sp. UB-Raua-W9 TaxID=1819736 RepID=UPI001BFCEEA7|nr:hypothetical protein [Polynucleobacter sp. UB-Raua-W9]QWD72726.1 hypothetical protein AOC07_01705 [Polynucleobacter sp. UB-Raua-W9]
MSIDNYRLSDGISLAKMEDADEIMDFINHNWANGHILGIHKDYFLYEYGSGEGLNFVISKSNNKIDGILGFIRPSSDQHLDVWLALWKVVKSSKTPLLGLKLLNFLRKQGFRSILCSGINQNTIDISKNLNFKIGLLGHYFIPNLNLCDYKIATIPSQLSNKFKVNFRAQDSISGGKFSIRKVPWIDLNLLFDFNKQASRVPSKDSNYFKKRFYDNPIYTYDIYGVYADDKLLSILVCKVVFHDGRKCIRIVDFYGEELFLPLFTSYLSKIMESSGYEYIDMLCAGLKEELIDDAGFAKVRDFDGLIVPNYFEPFVKENIQIHYCAHTIDYENLRVFKADGDQDRASFYSPKSLGAVDE